MQKAGVARFRIVCATCRNFSAENAERGYKHTQGLSITLHILQLTNYLPPWLLITRLPHTEMPQMLAFSFKLSATVLELNFFSWKEILLNYQDAFPQPPKRTINQRAIKY